MNAVYPSNNLKDFYGRDFYVNPDVLIPRPETEQLIDMVLNLAGKPYLPGVKPSERKLGENPIILDVGTGSGCIAITLKLELPESKVVATDISKKAIKIAQKNAEKFGISITTIISNLLGNVKFTPDVIVANLPYVDDTWGWLDKATLSQEPSIALYAKDGGLELIKKIIKQSKERKVKFLILESDPCQHEKVTKFAKKYHYNLSETRGFVQCFEY